MAKPIKGNGLSQFDGVEDRILLSLTSRNLQFDSLGIGTGKPGSAVGKTRARYVDVDLTDVPDLGNVDVSHRLGVRPTLCELVEISNAGAAGPVVQASPVSKHLWTGTNCRVAITLTGTQAGTVLKFRVGGA